MMNSKKRVANAYSMYKNKFALGGEAIDYFANNEGLVTPDSEVNEPDTEETEPMFGEEFLSPQVRIKKNHSTPQVGGSDFVSHIVSKESGGNYKAMSPNSSATGKYQFLWGTHGKRIQELTGVSSREEFANNPQAQEAYFSYYTEKELRPAAKKYLKALQADIPGVTEGDVMSAYHFAGPGNLQKAIKNKDYSTPLDANGTSILSYITPKNNTMRKRKYLTGGEVGGIVQGGMQLLPQIMSLIDNMGNNGAYSTQPVVTDRQTAAYSPYSRDFGNTNLPKFALGGQVPIEAEGEEVIETPDGNMRELDGASHEQGGIDMNVPSGTKIYSDRLQIDGSSMADRKKNRETIKDRFSKMISKNPNDILLKNSAKRTSEVLEEEERKDMEIQKATQAIMESKPGTFAWGGVPYSMGDEYTPYEEAFNSSIRPDVPLVGEYGNPISKPIATPTTLQPVNADVDIPTGSGFQMPSTGFTTGDMVGMAGNLFNAFAPIMNTNRNRAGDTPNINAYKTFGRDALDANEQTKTYVAGQRENALTDLKQGANASKASNRNSARGVNTVRALDAVTDINYNKGVNSIYDNFARQMMSILGQQSQLENVQDQYVMAGEQARDLADRQDRDNYYTQRGENLTNLGTNIQGLGRNLNTNQRNQDQLSLIGDMSQYGFRPVRRNGKIIWVKDNQ